MMIVMLVMLFMVVLEVVMMPKIGPKINKIEIWLKSGPKVINSPNQSHRGHIWGMFEL